MLLRLDSGRQRRMNETEEQRQQQRRMDEQTTNTSPLTKFQNKQDQWQQAKCAEQWPVY